MKKRLTRIAPLRAGTVFGILAFVCGLLFLALGLLGVALGNGIAPAVFMMPIYAGLYGFIVGYFTAVSYNLVSKWAAIEFEWEDAKAI